MPIKSTSTNSLFTSCADPASANNNNNNNVSVNASPLHMSICNVIPNKDKHIDNNNNNNNNISAHYASSVNHSHNIYSQINQAMTSFATPIVGSILTNKIGHYDNNNNVNIVSSGGSNSNNVNMMGL